MDALGTDEFIRVRVGIQPYHPVRDLATYVLAPIPTKGALAEEAAMGIQAAADAIEVILKDGPQWAMTNLTLLWLTATSAIVKG